MPPLPLALTWKRKSADTEISVPLDSTEEAMEDTQTIESDMTTSKTSDFEAPMEKYADHIEVSLPPMADLNDAKDMPQEINVEIASGSEYMNGFEASPGDGVIQTDVNHLNEDPPAPALAAAATDPTDHEDAIEDATDTEDITDTKPEPAVAITNTIDEAEENDVMDSLSQISQLLANNLNIFGTNKNNISEALNIIGDKPLKSLIVFIKNKDDDAFYPYQSHQVSADTLNQFILPANSKLLQQYLSKGKAVILKNQDGHATFFHKYLGDEEKQNCDHILMMPVEQDDKVNFVIGVL